MPQLRALVLLFLFVVQAAPLPAQGGELQPLDLAVALRPDVWGQEGAFVEGRLQNDGERAWAVEELVARVHSADGALIGEAFGFLTGACGEALPADHVLRPAESAPFVLQLDLFGAEEVPPDASIDVLPQASPRDVATPGIAQDLPGIRQVDSGEVVELEWVDARRLRYSSGCWRDVFTQRDWFELDLLDGERGALPAHPRAEGVTEPLLQAIGQSDPLLFRRSFFSFAPGQRRAFYRSAANSLVTVEPNGSFPRVIVDDIYNISLQGISWQGDSGVFVAWFHAGQGTEVSYAVGNSEGRRLSLLPAEAIPSRTVPGVSASGHGLVISATIDGVTGYFLKDSATNFAVPMFEAEPPGHHWPAPWYASTPGGRRIYIARPVEGQARLQCYNPDSETLHDLSPLPLRLAPDARSRMALSPDFTTLALAANGVDGGLWLIDLQRFALCL
ncbi:MAG: hypothetical protein OXF32_06975 [Anaerolineaceae bacterium]|nr:hypothetical protein [Anaerolineaceae bacterium]